MKTYAKPWTTYCRGFEVAIDHLLEISEDPTPFGDFCNVRDWIHSLQFLDLLAGDDNSRRLARYLTEERVNEFTPFLGGNEQLVQLALRCNCALSFCKGRIEKRKEFDWTQDRQQVFEYLLIDFWRQSASHWAHVVFPTKFDLSSIAEL